MKLYFIRHGQSEANVLRAFSNRGWTHGLTKEGKQQVGRLSMQLAGKHITALYTSPLRRAVETAEILGQALGLGHRVTDALREFDCGVLEGTSGDTACGIHDKVILDWLIRHDWDSRIEGGESFRDIRARFGPFIETLTSASSGASGSAAIVGHGGLYRCMLPLVFGNVDFVFAMSNPIPYASTVVAEARPAGLVCLEWAGVPMPSLLDSSPLPNSGTVPDGR